ncbi:hypothetical protein MMC18_005956 [Xylographa bjoerkii]|nr:hypothetical protein [Xylographa bjoerkii]
MSGKATINVNVAAPDRESIAKNMDDSLEQIQTAINQISHAVKTMSPENYPLWVSKMQTLRHTALAKAPVESEHFPDLVPTIICDDTTQWPDITTIKQAAIAEGAEATGVFLVTLPSSEDRYSLRDLDGHLWAKDITFSRATMHPRGEESEIFDLKLKMLTGFASQLTTIPSWPHQEIDSAQISQHFDAFETQLAEVQRKGGYLVTTPYAINLDADTLEQREALGLPPVSPLFELGGNLLPDTSQQYPGIHTPEAFISAEEHGAPFGVHMEDFALDAINYLVQGAPKLWCVISPSSAGEFEELIAEEYQIEPRRCSQFVRHHYCWPTRKALEDAGITYSLVYQQQHQAVITIGKAYHYGFNLGSNIAEAINYSDTLDLDPAYVECSRNCGAGSQSAYVNRKGLSAVPPIPVESEADHDEGDRSKGNGDRGKGKGRASSKSRLPVQSGPSKPKANAGTKNSRKRNKPSSSGPSNPAPSKKTAMSSLESERDVNVARQYTLYCLNSIEKIAKELPVPQASSTRNTKTTLDERHAQDIACVVNTIGTPVSLQALRNILMEVRPTLTRFEADEYSIPILSPRNSAMSKNARYRYICSIDPARSLLVLLKRYHLVMLVTELEEPNSNSELVIEPSRRPPGNPIKRAKSEEITAIIEALNSNLDPQDALVIDDEKTRTEIKKQKKLGDRLRKLVQIYGSPILSLIPDYYNNRSIDILISRFTEDQFHVFLELLNRSSGPRLRKMCQAVEEFIPVIIEEQRLPEFRLLLEDPSIDIAPENILELLTPVPTGAEVEAGSSLGNTI